jgi:surface protein
MLPVSLPSLHSELVKGQASSQRYPSDPINGVACPRQWLPVLLAGTHPPASRRRQARAFMSKGSLRRAVQAFNANTTDASAAYGPIADWDVSAITDMSGLLYGLQNFNADISSWDTSGVTDVSQMFQVPPSVPRPQLPVEPTPFWHHGRALRPSTSR